MTHPTGSNVASRFPVGFFAALLVAAGSACRPLPEPAQAPAVVRPASPPATASEDKPNALVAAAAEPPTPTVLSPDQIKACVKKRLIAGPELAKTWPSLAGRQVALDAEVVRAVDMAQLVVKADSEQFLVVAMPGQTWPGHAVRLFTVIGRGMAHVRGGPQHLAQLMLVDDNTCEPADLE